MPEAPFRLCADYYLVRVNALCGPLASLDEVGAYYRAHNSNNYFASKVNLTQLQQHLLRVKAAHEHIRDFAGALGFAGYPAEVTRVPDEMFLAQRIVSCKLDPQLHPFEKDTLLSLSWQGAQAILLRSELSLITKFVHILWFAAMVYIPKPIAPWLARKFFPETRHSFNKLLAILQGGRKHNSINRNSDVHNKQFVAGSSLK
jgi:hypothetical protein